MGAEEATVEEMLRAAAAGAEEATVEQMLRAAAAEVSTSSAKSRLRVFGHTLPPLVAKATMTPSNTALLVDLIFQTLPIYDDRASRKAVDDMVIQALGEPAFMKPFAAVLIRSMEKNVKVTNPLTSFKLLRWSHYLLKWSQFATLSKGAFTRLANAQAVLCQVLMDGSFHWRRTCKQLFIHLFSEPSGSGIYKMYIEDLRDLRISMRECPAFLNLILDSKITSPSLSTECKSVFLDLYVKTILSSKDQTPKAATEAFMPLFLKIGHEDFKNTVIPSCIKMLKRNPEIVLESIGYLLKTVCLDLSKYSMEFMPVVLHQARHSDEERRINALSIIGTLSEKSSDPDALPSMVNAIKAVLGGSEGKLSLPYERIGAINALEQLSRSPPKQIGRLAPSVSSFLVKCYTDDGIEEVKLAILSAIGSWASVSAEAVQPDVVSFIATGLKEKDTLRKGHLKLLRVICKNSDSLTKVASLLDHLIQLSKTGFSKATQRLDGIYALFAVSTLAAVDTKADSTIVKEKLWTLIAQNEPSLVSLQLLPKLADNDCLAVQDLLQSLFVKHFFRVQEYFSIQSLLQLQIYLLCHPSWGVRKIASDATKKIFSSSSGLVEDILFLFTDWLSLVGESLSLLKQGSSDSRLPFIPSTERLQRRLRQEQIFFVDLITPNISVICKELLSQDGLFSSNKPVQSAALRALSTLMTITPNDTLLEFEKHFIGLQERTLHDSISQRDIEIFYTPEGELSTEQGFYIGEAKTTKEEDREFLLKEEASVRMKVVKMQNILSIMLEALGKLAIANPIFTHGQLPSLVNYVEPLLSSVIVSDAAFCTMLRLARCTSPPLCNWAPVIAAAIRVISADEFELVFDLTHVIMEDSCKKKPSSGLFEQTVNGLSIACKAGPLPAETFTFVFPIIERILLSSKKTCLHDDLFHILSMHVDPILPLPRLRMLSVLYHLLTIDCEYRLSIWPMLGALGSGLRSHELAQALDGVYAEQFNLRRACLIAIKYFPVHSVQQDLQASTSLWIAVHDPEKAVAELADELWCRFGFDVITDYSGIFDALSHEHYNVRVASAEALAASLCENKDKMQDALSTLFNLYTRYLAGIEFGDAHWLGRQGIALALQSIAKVSDSKDLPVIMKFLIPRGLADPNVDVRGRMINAGVFIIQIHGNENVPFLLPIFESYLNERASGGKTYDLVKEGVVIFADALAEHRSKATQAYPLVTTGLSQRQKAMRDVISGSETDCTCPDHPKEVRINVLSPERDGAEGKRRWFRFIQLAISIVLFHAVMMVCNLSAPRVITDKKMQSWVVSGLWVILAVLFIWLKSKLDKKYGSKSTKVSVLAQGGLHAISLFLFSNFEDFWTESQFFSLLLAHATSLLLEIVGSFTIMSLLQVDVDMEGSDL